MTVEPAYPLRGIMSLLSAALLALLMTTNFVRRSWNRGVAFLTFWLFWETLTFGVMAFIWSDNGDIKAPVFCDIVSRLQLVTYVAKSACTLIITRRLAIIASVRSVEIKSRIIDTSIDWTLGFVFPMVVAGPLYYIVQGARSQILEGIGCSDAADPSILQILLIASWPVIFPFASLVIYYPRIIFAFLRHRKDIKSFLASNSSISRSRFNRVLIVGSIDIIFTFPISLVTMILNLKFILQQTGDTFYVGWSATHTDSSSVFNASFADLASDGKWSVAETYFQLWNSIVLGLIIFALFGLTPESRATYKRMMVYIPKRFFGYSPRSVSEPEEMVFAEGVRQARGATSALSQSTTHSAVMHPPPNELHAQSAGLETCHEAPDASDAEKQCVQPKTREESRSICQSYAPTRLNRSIEEV